MHRETQIQATRKPHCCFWCGESIEVGHPAVSQTWTWEGQIYSGHYHPECREAMRRSECPDDGWSYGMQKRGVAYNEFGDPIPTQATA